MNEETSNRDIIENLRKIIDRLSMECEMKSRFPVRLFQIQIFLYKFDEQEKLLPKNKFDNFIYRNPLKVF